MDKIRSIVLIACLLSIAISILDMLYPSKKFEQQVRFIFSLVFLIGLATPFLTGGITFPSISFPDENYSDITDSVNSQMNTAVEGNIEKALGNKLSAEKISVKNISVSVTILGEDSISINKVQIVPEDKADSDRIKKIISGELGMETNITVAEEGSDG